jgi:hypothetical protein
LNTKFPKNLAHPLWDLTQNQGPTVTHITEQFSIYNQSKKCSQNSIDGVFTINMNLSKGYTHKSKKGVMSFPVTVEIILRNCNLKKKNQICH